MDIYPAVDRLAALISYNFSFPTSNPRYRISSLPEPQLISLLIVAVKLYYPFDSIRRYPRSSSEPSALLIDWKAWAAAQDECSARISSGRELRRGQELGIGEHNVLSMSGGQIDEYLDWYEKTWIDDEARNSNSSALPQQLLDMFPIAGPEGPAVQKAGTLDETYSPRAEEKAILDTVKKVQRAMKMGRVISDEDAAEIGEAVVRPGSCYKRYRRIDDLSPEASAFFAAAARVVGISLHTLIKAVLQTENKLQVWKLEQRRSEASKLMGDEGQALVTSDSEHGSE